MYKENSASFARAIEESRRILRGMREETTRINLMIEQSREAMSDPPSTFGGDAGNDPEPR